MQVDAGISAVFVALQLAALQTTPLSWTAQAPLRHCPVVPQVEAAVATHIPFGSAPLFTGEQVPSLPRRLHEVQAPVQSVLQQMPAAQCLFKHSLLLVQSAPLGASPHRPLLQVLGAVH